MMPRDQVGVVRQIAELIGWAKPTVAGIGALVEQHIGAQALTVLGRPR